MVKHRKLGDVYAISSQDALLSLYREWAHSYDSGFGDAQGYQLPREVAQAYVSAGGRGNVLDVGAGTGLVAENLQRMGVRDIDGIDLSEDMLNVAEMKGLYRELFAADITAPLVQEFRPYDGVVSAGTFTMGHVGAEGIRPLLALAKSGAQFVISVNAAHYENSGFATEMASLATKIEALTLVDVRIYDDRADDVHSDDIARLIVFRKV